MCVFLILLFFQTLSYTIFPLDEVSSTLPGAAEVGPPKFLTQVASTIEISEGQSAHFEARLTPTEDANLKVYTTFFLILILS